MLTKQTGESSNTDKHDKQITEISFKLSDYEDRLGKLIIKDTQIQPMYLHITKITDTSSNIDKHEEQLTEITSKSSAYEIRLEKLNTSNTKKNDTEMKEHEEKLNTEFDKILII